MKNKSNIDDLYFKKDEEFLDFDGIFHKNTEIKIKVFDKEKMIKFIPAYLELRVLNSILENENKNNLDESNNENIIECVFIILNYFFPKEISSKKNLLKKSSLSFIQSFYSFITNYIFEGFDKKKIFQKEILKKLSIPLKKSH